MNSFGGGFVGDSFRRAVDERGIPCCGKCDRLWEARVAVFDEAMQRFFVNHYWNSEARLQGELLDFVELGGKLRGSFASPDVDRHESPSGSADGGGVDLWIGIAAELIDFFFRGHAMHKIAHAVFDGNLGILVGLGSGDSRESHANKREKWAFHCVRIRRGFRMPVPARCNQLFEPGPITTMLPFHLSVVWGS